MARGPIARVTHRIGYRGTTLLLLAFVDLAYGRTFIDPDPGQEQVIRYFAAVLPPWAWAGGWWLTGVACLVSAFIRRDLVGYGLSFALYVGYVAATLFGGAHGMPNAATRGTVWGFVALWVFVEARRPEPQRDIGEVAREMEETGEIPKYPDDGQANA